MQADRDVRGDALDDGVVGRDRPVENLVDIQPGRPEPLEPLRVDEVGIEGKVELDVASPGLDRVCDQASLDLDRVGYELLEVAVGVLGCEGERVAEE